MKTIIHLPWGLYAAEHFMPTRVWTPIAHLVFHSFFSVGCYCSD